MTEDWLDIALRFAVYADLMVLFGVPLFATSSFGPPHHDSWISRRYARLSAAACVLGTVLSLLALAVMAKQMAGASDYSEITGHVFEVILTRTGAGVAWVVRLAALAACLLALVAMRGRSRARFIVTSCGGAIALATLAWAGHGAMDEGARGWLHLASDIVHLIAAGAWVGALVAFVALSATDVGQPGSAHVEMLARAASGFARVGTTIVLALLLTGVTNYVLIVGPTLQGLVSTLYGRVLDAKLALFAAMLALAAANRFLHAPRLASALAAGQHGPAAFAFRRSLWIESGLAFVVLAVVAWLGVLSPP